jgi:hypothetical protein
MGIFKRGYGRASNAAKSAVSRTEWRPDDAGVFQGYDRTADIVVGDAWSVRFVRDDMPGSLITVAFYPVEYDENPGEFIVQRETEWMVCENPADPGGTEIWSDALTDDPMPETWASVAEAEADCRSAAEVALGVAWAYGTWDGRPEYGEAV